MIMCKKLPKGSRCDFELQVKGGIDQTMDETAFIIALIAQQFSTAETRVEAIHDMCMRAIHYLAQMDASIPERIDLSKLKKFLEEETE